jgi:hypothetical protein
MGSGLKALVEKSPTSSVEQSRLTAKMMILAVMGKADIYRENSGQSAVGSGQL